jgi:RNA polymerase primary sigma factor
MKTYEEDPSTRVLIEETKKYKILSRETEHALFEEYHRIRNWYRKQEIKTLIIQSYLRFVLAMARAYKNQNGLPINDFFAEGKLGLLEAFDKFDYKQGIKFGSFAVFEVRRHMELIVNTSDMVRVPVRLRKVVLDRKKKGQSLDGIKYGQLAANAVREATSTSAPVGGDDADGRMTIEETIESDWNTDENHEETYLSDQLRDIMEDNLTAEENNLLRRLYGLDGWEDTVSDISAEKRVSKELIRRVRTKALAKLRGLKEVAELRASFGT